MQNQFVYQPNNLDIPHSQNILIIDNEKDSKPTATNQMVFSFYCQNCLKYYHLNNSGYYKCNNPECIAQYEF
jgi:hypothetical protein